MVDLSCAVYLLISSTMACMRENSAKFGILGGYFEQWSYMLQHRCSKIGSARAIAHDIAALNKAIEIAEQNQDSEPIFYVLAW